MVLNLQTRNLNCNIYDAEAKLQSSLQQNVNVVEIGSIRKGNITLQEILIIIIYIYIYLKT
jgi:hypothetical protein